MTNSPTDGGSLIQCPDCFRVGTLGGHTAHEPTCPQYVQPTLAGEPFGVPPGGTYVPWTDDGANHEDRPMPRSAWDYLRDAETEMQESYRHGRGGDIWIARAQVYATLALAQATREASAGRGYKGLGRGPLQWDHGPRGDRP